MGTEVSRTRRTRDGTYAFLDGLRGWAALWVVLNHLEEHLPSTFTSIPIWIRDPLILRGGLGVMVFFAISGLVISRSIARVDMNGAQFGNFMARRLARLSPAYYASLGLAIAVNLISTWAKDERFSGPTPAEALAHLLYLPDLLGMTMINGVHWTLYIEVQFYLLLALFCFLLARSFARSSPRVRIAMLVVVAAASLAWPLGFQLTRRESWFLPYLSPFLGGCFIFWRRNGTVPRWLFNGFVILLGVAAAWHTQEVYVAGFAAVALIAVADRVPGAMTGWLSDRVSQFLGRISYSLYLVHAPVLGATFYLGTKLLGESGTGELALVVPEVVLSIIVATIVYRLVERPSILWSRGLRRRPGLDATPDVA